MTIMHFYNITQSQKFHAEKLIIIKDNIVIIQTVQIPLLLFVLGITYLLSLSENLVTCPEKCVKSGKLFITRPIIFPCVISS